MRGRAVNAVSVVRCHRPVSVSRGPWRCRSAPSWAWNPLAVKVTLSPVSTRSATEKRECARPGVMWPMTGVLVGSGRSPTVAARRWATLATRMMSGSSRGRVLVCARSTAGVTRVCVAAESTRRFTFCGSVGVFGEGFIVIFILRSPGARHQPLGCARGPPTGFAAPATPATAFATHGAPTTAAGSAANSRYTAEEQATIRAARAIRRKSAPATTGEFWCHTHDENRIHHSPECQRPGEGHRTTATRGNRMGGPLAQPRR
mmetsp:Transcript_26096/g.65222  ORF Transcript_26096/g.65222 Transcript_26096/m.65222 type:complete len:260 (-) Transcript_26096:72-851(-)